MTKPVIEVRNLSKEYRLGAIGARSLRDEAERLFTRLKQRKEKPREANHFWALRDLSFDVQPGRVVGLIGKNGAGKSTLLKILSRVTQPTSGTAVLRGRVASLLEVGTGFHPELTGRENVYLNGSILGLKRREIKARFDEIVAFSELERHIDTPVKRYSSGQHVRLAFAVAAHLEAEILLLDEVLAVGDVAFQEKCLRKVRDITQGAERSILFVSHNLGAIASLCDEAVVLQNGRELCHCGAKEGVQRYLESLSGTDGAALSFNEISSDASFSKLALRNQEHSICSQFKCSEPIHVSVEYCVKRKMENLEVNVEVYEGTGQKVFYTALSHLNPALARHEEGRYQVAVEIPSQFLTPGRYTMGVSLHEPNVCYFDRREHATAFTILETGSRDYKYANTNIGMVFVNLPWKRDLVGTNLIA